MNAVQESFVIIHIRISHIKFFGFSLRNIITVVLIFLTVLSLIKLVTFVSAWDFLLSAIYMVTLVYVIYNWLLSWSKANRHLNNAVNSRKEGNKDDS